MFGKKRGNKPNKIAYFFTIYRKSKPDEILSITNSKEEASECAEQIVYNDYEEQYKAWCRYQDLDVNSESWEQFLMTRIPDEELADYVIAEVGYNFNTIASIIRMFGKCKPTGCSFELPIEFAYAKSLEAEYNAKKEVVESLKEISAEFQAFDPDDVDGSLDRILDTVKDLNNKLLNQFEEEEDGNK